MIEPIFIGALLALLAVQHFLHGRQVKAERAHHIAREKRQHEDLREALDHNRELQNQIVLLKVQPQQAAVQAITVPDDEYLSLSDDEALAEYELERAQQ